MFCRLLTMNKVVYGRNGYLTGWTKANRVTNNFC